MELYFDWDVNKAVANARKHGVTFDEARSVFDDPLSLDIPDPLHSEIEERWVKIGESSAGRLLVVIYLERGRAVRLISARIAEPRERRQYEDGS
jgi:uncharacterized DUF497 family protein